MENIEKIITEFNEEFPLPKILALSGGKGVERDLMNNFWKKKLSELYSLGKQETEKAFGGCTNCYGKGYFTEKSQSGSERVGYWENEPMNPCSCDRGTQIEAHMKRLLEKGIQDGLKLALTVIPEEMKANGSIVIDGIKADMKLHSDMQLGFNSCRTEWSENISKLISK